MRQELVKETNFHYFVLNIKPTVLCPALCMSLPGMLVQAPPVSGLAVVIVPAQISAIAQSPCLGQLVHTTDSIIRSLAATTNTTIFPITACVSGARTHGTQKQ